MYKSTKQKRTEAILSIIVASALTITLAVTVAYSIREGLSNKEENRLSLNETIDQTESFSADNSSSNEISKADSYAKNDNVPKTKQTDPVTKANPDNENKADKTKSDSTSASDITAGSENQDAMNNAQSDDDNLSAGNENAQSPIQDVPVISGNNVSSRSMFNESTVISLPVQGEILLNYNMEGTVYFPTLNIYKCNPGLYIQSTAGEYVYNCAPGVVTNIEETSEMSNVITVDLGNGYTAIYGQLDTPTVTIGETIISGAIIGKVASPTAYFSKEGDGVYFELLKDGIPVNPLDYTE